MRPKSECGGAADNRERCGTPELRSKLFSGDGNGGVHAGRSAAGAQGPFTVVARATEFVFIMATVMAELWQNDGFWQLLSVPFSHLGRAGARQRLMGAIAVAPANSNVLYVVASKTGRRPDLGLVDGIYKSNQSMQENWTHLGYRANAQHHRASVVDRE